jgi:uncharacterized protein
MELERKAFPATDLKAEGDEGRMTAIVAVFNNVDSGGDVIEPGAFKGAMGRRRPKGVWMHDFRQPIAYTDHLTELQPGNPRLPESIRELGGLEVKATFNLDTQRGRESFSDIRRGIIDEFSIGYNALRHERDEKREVRILKTIDLYEWSPVLAGMNPLTALVDVKSGNRRTFADELDDTLSSIDSLLSRAGEIRAIRLQKGRDLAVARREQLMALQEKLTELQSLLGSSSTGLAAMAQHLLRQQAERDQESAG